MRVLLVNVLLVSLIPVSLSSCQYYADYRLKQTQADVQEERAELMRAYRECLKKYESDPQKSRDFCAPYTQSLREIEIRSGR
jgi:hypothetical protein